MSAVHNGGEGAWVQGRTEMLDRLKATLADPDARFKVPELHAMRFERRAAPARGCSPFRAESASRA